MERENSLKLLNLIAEKMGSSQSMLEYACLERHGQNLAKELINEGTELENIPLIFKKDRKRLKELIDGKKTGINLSSVEHDVNLYDDVDSYVRYCENYIKENKERVW